MSPVFMLPDPMFLTELEDVQDQPEVAVGGHHPTLPVLVIGGRDNAARFLTPVLKGVQAVIRLPRRFGGVHDAKDAAVLFDASHTTGGKGGGPP